MNFLLLKLLKRYFHGILFLTTNRVRRFDEAFQSRIHVSLWYRDLEHDSRRKIWIAFLKKAKGDSDLEFTDDEINDLSSKKVNGRQIKNVVRTANALASTYQEELAHRHLTQVLEMMERFDSEWKSSPPMPRQYRLLRIKLLSGYDFGQTIMVFLTCTLIFIGIWFT